MTVVVGFAPDAAVTGPAALGGRIAAATGQSLVLCCVRHDAFRTDEDRTANNVTGPVQEAVEAARAVVPAEVAVDTVVIEGRSVPHALQQEGQRRGADLLVVGSSSGGPFGHISLGSTTNRLVHGAGVPVALAPRGYRVADDSAITRLVLAVGPAGHDTNLAPSVAALATAIGAPVEVVTFKTSPSQPSAVGPSVDRAVQGAWADRVREGQAAVVDALRTAGAGDLVRSDTRVVVGSRWSDAVERFDWDAGDLLVVGSSEHGPLGAVFLGSNGARLLRHAPVPVVMVPRSR